MAVGEASAGISSGRRKAEHRVLFQAHPAVDPDSLEVRGSQREKVQRRRQVLNPRLIFLKLEIDHKTLKTLIIAPGYCVYVVPVNKYL